MAVCPECRQGKCPNCDGYAWDDKADAEVPCEHDCRVPTPDDVPLFAVSPLTSVGG